VIFKTLLSYIPYYYNKKVSLNEEQTSFDDLLDALRLSLKGYTIQ